MAPPESLCIGAYKGLDRHVTLPVQYKRHVLVSLPRDSPETDTHVQGIPWPARAPQGERARPCLRRQVKSHVTLRTHIHRERNLHAAVLV